MAELKTRPTKASVSAFLNAIEDPDRRRDCKKVARMLREATGKRPKMWGPSIVGYGSYHYVYASGNEGDWMATGFSPRKRELTVYIMNGFADYAPLLKKLGKYKTGKSCLYIKDLDAIDLDVLRELVVRSVRDLGKRWGCTITS